VFKESKEFTKFGSAVSRMYRLHNGTKLLVFLSVFLRVFFSKCSMKMVITGEIGEPIAAPEVVHKIDCYRRSKRFY